MDPHEPYVIKPAHMAAVAILHYTSTIGLVMWWAFWVAQPLGVAPIAVGVGVVVVHRLTPRLHPDAGADQPDVTKATAIILGHALRWTVPPFLAWGLA